MSEHSAPAGCDVVLSFDFDAEEVWIGSDPKNEGRPGTLSQGTYGAKVAVPLILGPVTLDLLVRHGFRYSSNLMDDIWPYRHAAHDLVELPVLGRFRMLEQFLGDLLERPGIRFAQARQVAEEFRAGQPAAEQVGIGGGR